MAQFYFDRLDLFARPGEPIENGDRYLDQDFYSRPPAVIFESNRTSNASSSFLVPVKAADVDVRLRVRVFRFGSQSFSNVGPGLFVRYKSWSDCLYFATRNPLTTSTWGGLYKLVDGSQTQLEGIDDGLVVDLFETFNVRIRLQGNQFQYSTWFEGAEEPALSDAATVNLTGAPASGFVGIRARQHPMIFEIDLLSIGTDGDTPPTEAQKSVSGVVSGANGNPADRTVRLCDRVTGISMGETVSDAITGEYIIKSDWPEECQAVFLAEEIVETGTASDGGATTLTDSTKDWAVDGFAGHDLILTDGTGEGQRRAIVSNTATELTVTPAWITEPDNTSEYEIEEIYNDLIERTIPG